MAEPNVLRTTKIGGGFVKDDVLNYVDELNSKNYLLQEELDKLKKQVESGGGLSDAKEAEFEAELTRLRGELGTTKNQLRAAQDELKNRPVIEVDGEGGAAGGELSELRRPALLAAAGRTGFRIPEIRRVAGMQDERLARLLQHVVERVEGRIVRPDPGAAAERGFAEEALEAVEADGQGAARLRDVVGRGGRRIPVAEDQPREGVGGPRRILRVQRGLDAEAAQVGRVVAPLVVAALRQREQRELVEAEPRAVPAGELQVPAEALPGVEVHVRVAGAERVPRGMGVVVHGGRATCACAGPSSRSPRPRRTSPRGRGRRRGGTTRPRRRPSGSS